MTTVGHEVATVRGERELAARVGHLFGTARSEFLCAATDLNTWATEAREQIKSRMRAAARPGTVRVRKLFTPAVLADEAAETQLLRTAAAGAEIRICPANLPHETIIIDARLAVLAGAAVAGDRVFTVIRSSTVVDGVRALFTAAWDQAVPLAEYRRGRVPVLRPESREILRQLAAGRKDEAAARLLGLSLRTYRRRVAELMTLLDADSRFQAGARAQSLGL